MKKRMLFAFAVIAFPLSFALASGSGERSQGNVSASAETIAANQEKSILTMYSAADLAAVVEASGVSVNGTVLDGSEVSINGAPALWEKGGLWHWKTHILFGSHNSGPSETYTEGAVNFIDGLSKLTGTSYTAITEGGKLAGLEFLIKDAAMAKAISSSAGYTSITLCGEEGDGSMNRTSPDSILFPNANVSGVSDGEQGVVVRYWLDGEGWHLERCESETATVLAGTSLPDTRINLEYSQSWNRPTQPVNAIGWMGQESAKMNVWYFSPGYVCGVSRADARNDLPSAIEIAEAALSDVTVSQNGSGLPVGAKWVTRDVYDTLQAAVDNAKAAYSNPALLNSDYEEAYFHLALTYGGDGSHYASSGNYFEDGFGFVTKVQTATAN